MSFASTVLQTFIISDLCCWISSPFSVHLSGIPSLILNQGKCSTHCFSAYDILNRVYISPDWHLQPFDASLTNLGVSPTTFSINKKTFKNPIRLYSVSSRSSSTLLPWRDSLQWPLCLYAFRQAPYPPVMEISSLKEGHIRCHSLHDALNSHDALIIYLGA